MHVKGTHSSSVHLLHRPNHLQSRFDRFEGVASTTVTVSASLGLSMCVSTAKPRFAVSTCNHGMTQQSASLSSSAVTAMLSHSATLHSRTVLTDAWHCFEAQHSHCIAGASPYTTQALCCKPYVCFTHHECARHRLQRVYQRCFSAGNILQRQQLDQQHQVGAAETRVQQLVQRLRCVRAGVTWRHGVNARRNDMPQVAGCCCCVLPVHYDCAAHAGHCYCGDDDRHQVERVAFRQLAAHLLCAEQLDGEEQR